MNVASVANRFAYEDGEYYLAFVKATRPVGDGKLATHFHYANEAPKDRAMWVKWKPLKLEAGKHYCLLVLGNGTKDYELLMAAEVSREDAKAYGPIFQAGCDLRKKLGVFSTNCLGFKEQVRRFFPHETYISWALPDQVELEAARQQLLKSLAATGQGDLPLLNWMTWSLEEYGDHGLPV